MEQNRQCMRKCFVAHSCCFFAVGSAIPLKTFETRIFFRFIGTFFFDCSSAICKFFFIVHSLFIRSIHVHIEHRRRWRSSLHIFPCCSIYSLLSLQNPLQNVKRITHITLLKTKQTFGLAQYYFFDFIMAVVLSLPLLLLLFFQLSFTRTNAWHGSALYADLILNRTCVCACKFAYFYVRLVFVSLPFSLFFEYTRARIRTLSLSLHLGSFLSPLVKHLLFLCHIFFVSTLN